MVSYQTIYIHSTGPIDEVPSLTRVIVGPTVQRDRGGKRDRIHLNIGNRKRDLQWHNNPTLTECSLQFGEILGPLYWTLRILVV